MVSIPNQHTIRQQIQDLCGKGDNDQALDDYLDLILDPVGKEYEAKVQLGSPLKNTKLATIVNYLYSETIEDEKLKKLLKKYNKPENCPYVFATRCNPEIWNKNLTTVHKGHDIELHKIQMHFVKAAYAITEACDRVMDSKLKSALCKEIATPLIDCLAFLDLASSEIIQFRRDYLKSRLPEKMKPLAKNVPENVSEWLFKYDLNKRINTVSSTNIALTASICLHYQYDKYQGCKAGNNQQHYG